MYHTRLGSLHLYLQHSSITAALARSARCRYRLVASITELPIADCIDIGPYRLWNMDAFLHEPRGKIGYVVKRANQKSKVDWSNAIAKRCRQLVNRGNLWVGASAEKSLPSLQEITPVSI